MDEGLSRDNLAFVMLANSVNDFLISFHPLFPATGQTILFKLPCLSIWPNQNGSQSVQLIVPAVLSSVGVEHNGPT